MKKEIVILVSLSVILSGCSTASKDIASNYVSPMQYQDYNCNQLTAETQRIHTRVNQLGGQLDEAASNDQLLTGVGLIIFWPALFALGGTKQQEAEYARLKGEYDAVQQTAVVKNCVGIVTQTETNTGKSPEIKTSEESTQPTSLDTTNTIRKRSSKRSRRR